MPQDYSNKNRWFFGTVTLLLISLLATTGCYAEPNGPNMTLTGTIVDRQEISTEDSQLKIEWPDFSVVITGKEIVKGFELDEGSLVINKKIISSISGLPVIDYRCNCPDIDPHRIYVGVDRLKGEVIITLSDSLRGAVLNEKVLKRIVPVSDKKISGAKPVSLPQFGLDNGILKVPGMGTLDLAAVLEGGKWRKVTNLTYDGYDGVVQWQCTTNIPQQIYCYCEPTDPVYVLQDTPTCWDYQRTAYVAFKKAGEYLEVDAIIFESNFDSEVQPLPRYWNEPGDVRVFQLESEM